MANVNKTITIGNLAREVELRHLPKGTALVENALAVNHVWKDDAGEKHERATFVDIKVWGRQAEVVAQYCTKGAPLYVEGRLEQDTWLDKESGQKRSKLQIVAENIQLLGGRRD